MTRNAAGMCLLKNKDVIVKNGGSAFGNAPVEKFACDAQDPNHNNEYWDADQDDVNEGYSPANDALYIGAVVKQMYSEWYHVPVLTDWAGQPMVLTMHAHGKDMFGSAMDNAYFFLTPKKCFSVMA